MKSTDLKRHAAALLLGLCLLIASALPVFATSANIKLTDSRGNPMTGSIHVTLYDNANNKPLSGGQLTLYKVADIQRKNGDLRYEYCGYFDGCGIDLGDLTDSTLADSLQAYLPENAQGTAVQTIDENGYAAFDDLELGLYLVVQTKASKGYKPVNSFLVSLPMAEDGKWNYEVDASPKVGAPTQEPETPDTPDTPVTPPVPTVPVTPDTPTVPETPETPDNPDTPVFPGTPDNPVAPGTPDNPVAPGTPDNPVAPGTPDNPVAPGTPDNPVMSGGLPQTGQLNWPVPVLAISGMLLFAAGWKLSRKPKNL